MGEHEQIDFKAVVDSYYTPLYRFAYSLAGNADEACDLTQQAYTVFARKRDTIRDASKVKSWLFTTLYREFLRQRKKKSQVVPIDGEIMESTVAADDTSAETAADSNTAVRALRALDETYREPLTLFYLQNFSYKEIAAVLDVPIGTVMSRLSRGKSHLRKQLTSAKEHAGSDE